MREIDEFSDEESHIEDRGTKVRDHKEHSLTTEERDEIIRKYNDEYSLHRITSDEIEKIEQSEKSIADSGDTSDTNRETYAQEMVRFDFLLESSLKLEYPTSQRNKGIVDEISKHNGDFLNLLVDCKSNYEHINSLMDSNSNIHREIISRLQGILSASSKSLSRSFLVDSENREQSIEFAITMDEVIHSSTYSDQILNSLFSLEIVNLPVSEKILSGYRAATLTRNLSTFRTAHTAGVECSRLSRELFCSDLGVSENHLIQAGLAKREIQCLSLANAFIHADSIDVYEGGLLSYISLDDSVTETPDVLQDLFSTIADVKNLNTNWSDFYFRSTRPAIEFLSTINFESEISDAQEVGILHYFSESDVYHKSTVEFRITKIGSSWSEVLKDPDGNDARKTSASWPGKGKWDLLNVADLPPISILIHPVNNGIISPNARAVYLSATFQMVVGQPYEKCRNLSEYLQGEKFGIFTRSGADIVIVDPDRFVECARSDKQCSIWKPNSKGVSMLEELDFANESCASVLASPQLSKESDMVEKFLHLMVKESREERISSGINDIPIITYFKREGIQVVRAQYLRDNVAGKSFLKNILQTPNLDEKRFEAMCPYNIGSTNRELSHDTSRKQRWCQIHDSFLGSESPIYYLFDQKLDLGYLSPNYHEKSRISKLPLQSRSRILGKDSRRIIDFLSPVPDLQDALLRPASNTQKGNIGYITFSDLIGTQQRFAYLSVTDNTTITGSRPLICADVNNLSSGRTLIFSQDLESYIEQIIERIQNGQSMIVDNRGKKRKIAFKWNVDIRPDWNLENEVVRRLKQVVKMMEKYRTCAEKTIEVIQKGDLENPASKYIFNEVALYSKKYKDAMDDFMELDNDLSSKIQRNALRSFMKYIGRLTGGISLQVGRMVERHLRSSSNWLEQSIHEWKHSTSPSVQSWDSATAQGYFSTLASLDRIRFSQLRRAGLLSSSTTLTDSQGWQSINNGIWVDMMGDSPAGQTFSDPRLAFDSRSIIAEVIRFGDCEVINQTFLSDIHSKAREYGAKASGEKYWTHKGAKDTFVNTAFSYNTYLEDQIRTISSNYNSIIPVSSVELITHLVKEYAYASQNFNLSGHKKGTKGAASIAYIRETKATNKRMVQTLLPKKLSAEIDCILNDTERIFQESERSVIQTGLREIAGRILELAKIPKTPESIKTVTSILLQN